MSAMIRSVFRLPEKLIARIDAYVVGLRESTPHVTFTRADGVRLLIIRGLDASTASAVGRRKRDD